MRDLVKQPLSEEELAKLAQKVGSVRDLVAPKRREEAAKVSDGKLIKWLAEDGTRVRRPIIVAGKKVTLGFTDAVREQLEGEL